MPKIAEYFIVWFVLVNLYSCGTELPVPSQNVATEKENQETPTTDTNEEDPSKEIEVTPEAYKPKDSISQGIFTFKTSKVQFSCTDTSTGVSDPILMNLRIKVDGNKITIESALDGTATDGVTKTAPGVSNLEISGYVGLIEKDGSFVAQQQARIDMLDFGPARINYTISGQISPNNTEWSGDYKYSVYFVNYYETCNYVATFNGTGTLESFPKEADQLVISTAKTEVQFAPERLPSLPPAPVEEF